MTLSKPSVVQSVQLVVVFCLVLCVSLAAVGFRAQQQAHADRGALVQMVEGQRDAARLVTLIYATLVEVAALQEATDAQSRANSIMGLEARSFEISEIVSLIRPVAERADAAPIDALSTAARAFQAQIAQASTLAREGKGAEAVALFRDNERQQALHVAAEEVAGALKEASEGLLEVAQARARRDAWLIGAVIAVICALGSGGLVVLRRQLVRPLKALVAGMIRLSQGDTGILVASVNRRDEIGDLARALQVFKTNRIERERLMAEKQLADAAIVARQHEVLGAIAAFDQAASAGTDAVARAAEDLRAAARSMALTAKETAQQAEVATESSARVASSAGALTRSGDVLANAVSDVASKVDNASRVAGQAADAATRTSAKVAELSSAANTIGGIVGLINAIAGQTNLLALNATIEAARAGEAGKGFAVVAAEVKQLATQTTLATEQIATNVDRVQSVTSETILAIRGIEAHIMEVGELAAAVADAVEQQRVAASEIAASVRDVAAGAAEVDTMIEGFGKTASQSGTVSVQVLGSAGLLSDQAQTMRNEIGRFLQTVRAA